MLIFGLSIPDGLAFGVAPVVLSLIFGWAAWVTLSTAGVKDLDEKVVDHEARLRTLEAKR